MRRGTIGKTVMCGQPDCPNFQKKWVVKPLTFNSLQGLHSWPVMICDECECEPIFMGYVEGEVPHR